MAKLTFDQVGVSVCCELVSVGGARLLWSVGLLEAKGVVVVV